MNIPDFVLQFEEIQRLFLTEVELANSAWNDQVSRRYNEQFIEPYQNEINYYLWGKRGNVWAPLRGYGLNELIELIEREANKCSKLCLVPRSSHGLFVPGRVHDTNLDRENWRPKDYEGFIPCDLDISDVGRLKEEQERTRNEWNLDLR